MEKLFVYQFDPKNPGVCVADLNDNFLSKGFIILKITPYDTGFLVWLIKEVEQPTQTNNKT